MPEPRFRVGQRVTFAAPTLITPDGDYAVVRVFPRGGLDQTYAIKAETEPYERVVGEEHLVLRQAEPVV